MYLLWNELMFIKGLSYLPSRCSLQRNALQSTSHCGILSVFVYCYVCLSLTKCVQNVFKEHTFVLKIYMVCVEFKLFIHILIPIYSSLGELGSLGGWFEYHFEVGLNIGDSVMVSQTTICVVFPSKTFKCMGVSQTHKRLTQTSGMQ